MTNFTSGQPWTLRMPAGSLQNWNFTFTTPAPGGVTPYSISGATWEYVVRSTATDLGTPLVSVTTTSSPSGQIVVISSSTLSQVQLTILPAATVSLDGTYYQTLWMNPSTTEAFTWLSGLLLVEGNPQP